MEMIQLQFFLTDSIYWLKVTFLTKISTRYSSALFSSIVFWFQVKLSNFFTALVIIFCAFPLFHVSFLFSIRSDNNSKSVISFKISLSVRKILSVICIKNTFTVMWYVGNIIDINNSIVFRRAT